MGICLRYARSSEDADDIFQDGFIKIFNKIESVQSAETLAGWMRRVMVNQAINYYRATQKQAAMHVDVQEVNVADQHYTDVLDNLDNKTLTELVQELPEGYRLVFNLYVVDGYSHKEISEMLEVSIGTSKSQLHAGRQMLKKKLLSMGITKYEKAI
jgi:RNA polymerase sigma-70 factor (ECF subfamily)